MLWRSFKMFARLLVASALLGSVGWTHPAHDREVHPRVGGWLGEAMVAWQQHDLAALQRVAAHGRALVDGPLRDGRWRVQLHLAPGVSADALTDADVARWQGVVAARGTDLVDVWLPLAQVLEFVDQHAVVAFAQLPWRMVQTAGPTMSDGAKALRTPEVQCLAAEGTGTTVAVLDTGFDNLDKAVSTGEVPHWIGGPLTGGGTHGTMCCEVVADTAPSAQILSYRTETMADMQAFAKKIGTQGNPDQISLVSHSAIWFGMSFGRHEGKACEITDMVRSGGVAWVNASGNSSGGKFYRATFADADGNGLHAFLPGEEKLYFQQYGGQIQVNLDWDDYTDRKVRLHLELYRKQDGAWQKIDESTVKPGKYVPPMQQIVVEDAKAGEYALAVRAIGKVPEGMRLRLVSLGYGASSLSVWQNNGNVYDPASCDGVLTVGAIYAGHYDTGPLESYSSYGPTADGRLKPEVMAPTGVATAQGVFFGTSAACPHAAGALAVWASATGQNAESLVQSMRNQAIPMGLSQPDDAYGFGRVVLPPASLGWDCSPTAGLPTPVTCDTACGTVGTRICTQACQWATCNPPGEACNGQDDDCDGQTDENLANCAPSVGPDAGAADAGLVDAGADLASMDAGLDAAGDATATQVAAAAPPAESGCNAGRTSSGTAWCLLLGLAALRLRRQRT